jgi:hypothetical protein
MKANSDLRLLTHIIRLADRVASTEDLTELYTSSFGDNTEALDEISSNPKSDGPSEYTLGYHRFSEIKPALGALIHDAVRDVVKEEGGLSIASRKDATIYLLPRNFDPALIDQAKSSLTGARRTGDPAVRPRGTRRTTSDTGLAGGTVVTDGSRDQARISGDGHSCGRAGRSREVSVRH